MQNGNFWFLGKNINIELEIFQVTFSVVDGTPPLLPSASKFW